MTSTVASALAAAACGSGRGQLLSDLVAKMVAIINRQVAADKAAWEDVALAAAKPAVELPAIVQPWTCWVTACLAKPAIGETGSMALPQSERRRRAGG